MYIYIYISVALPVLDQRTCKVSCILTVRRIHLRRLKALQLVSSGRPLAARVFQRASCDRTAATGAKGFPGCKDHMSLKYTLGPRGSKGTGMGNVIQGHIQSLK